MASIDNILDQFKDVAEVKAYAEGQSKIIIELSKKNKKLEDEIKRLNNQIEEYKITEIKTSIKLDTSDEEYIARIQIAMLKKTSDERELTYEESKKVELYTKILKEIDSRRQKQGNEPNFDVPVEDLLRLVKNE